MPADDVPGLMEYVIPGCSIGQISRMWSDEDPWMTDGPITGSGRLVREDVQCRATEVTRIDQIEQCSMVDEATT